MKKLQKRTCLGLYLGRGGKVCLEPGKHVGDETGYLGWKLVYHPHKRNSVEDSKNLVHEALESTTSIPESERHPHPLKKTKRRDNRHLRNVSRGHRNLIVPLG